MILTKKYCCLWNLEILRNTIKSKQIHAWFKSFLYIYDQEFVSLHDLKIIMIFCHDVLRTEFVGVMFLVLKLFKRWKDWCIKKPGCNRGRGVKILVVGPLKTMFFWWLLDVNVNKLKSSTFCDNFSSSSLTYKCSLS